MKIQVEKILKRKSPKQVDAQIKLVKKAVKSRFNLSNFNIPEAESCIRYMEELINLHEAKSIMKTARYKAYEESGKSVNYSTFLSK